MSLGSLPGGISLEYEDPVEAAVWFKMGIAVVKRNLAGMPMSMEAVAGGAQ